MSEALPALSLGLINSVIAPFAKPPPVTLSKKDKPVLKCVPGSNCFCGKRSTSRFLRSTMLPRVPIRKGWHKLGICSSEQLSFPALPGRLLPDERDDHALNPQLARGRQIRVTRVFRL